MTHPHDASPVNPLPPVVVALFLAIVLPEAAFSLGAQGLVGGPGAVGWRLAAVERYGFSADLLHWMIDNRRWVPELLMRFVTYPFVNVGFTSTLFGAVMVLALGKMVSEIMGQLAVAVIFVGAGIFGALCYGLLLNDASWLAGAFPPVYGLIGGYTYVLWRRLAGRGSQQYRAFTLIAMLMGLQLIWGALFGANTQWVADLGGFAFGFGASFLLAPGAMARLVGALRRD